MGPVNNVDILNQTKDTYNINITIDSVDTKKDVKGLILIQVSFILIQSNKSKAFKVPNLSDSIEMHFMKL